MEKKLDYNIYQCQMVSSGMVSNGVEWCGDVESNGVKSDQCHDTGKSMEKWV